MLRMLSFALAGPLWAIVASGCAGPPVTEKVTDIRIVGVFDQTGRCPSDIRTGLVARIPNMAVEVGLIGGTGEGSGAPIHMRADVIGFPPKGQLGVGTMWIEAGPMTVEWTIMEEDGTQIAKRTITTDPRNVTDAPEDPFVYGQSRAVVRWLLGR